MGKKLLEKGKKENSKTPIREKSVAAAAVEEEDEEEEEEEKEEAKTEMEWLILAPLVVILPCVE